MLIENWDRTIGAGITVVSAGFAWWAHLRQIEKERRRVLLEERDKYAAERVQETNAQRDFAHLQRNLKQLSGNVAQLSSESDLRLDKLEAQVQKLIGAVNVLNSALSRKE